MSVPVFVTVLTKATMTTFPTWQIQGSPQFSTLTTMYLPDEPPLLADIGGFGSMGFAAMAAALKDQIGTAVEGQLGTLLPAFLGGGVDVQGQILSTPVPGGGSVADFQALLGLNLDARTHDTILGATLTVTTRFLPLGVGGTISGTLRFPKEQCSHTTKSSHLLGTMKLPTGFTETNTDLVGYVGQPCQVAPLPSDGVVADFFLGMTPPGTSLSNWQEVGNFRYVGTLTDAGTEGYYECGFELDVPNGFLALSNELEGRLQPEDLLDPATDRYLMLAGQLFDRSWAPQAPGQLVIGGPGQCSPDRAGGGLHEHPALDKLKEFDPENCWACGPRLQNVVDQKLRPIDLRRPDLQSKFRMPTKARASIEPMGARIPAAAARAKGLATAPGAGIEAMAPATSPASVETLAPARAGAGIQSPQSRALGAMKGIESTTPH
ncbi:MAG: hypothetical protein CL910_09015 [Deltaproteobacteria bacterium]|nr:hypothetical protein [Deltaproteobacteria bacterium]